MFAPDSKWRCKEDLKVILITKEGRLSKALAFTFFRRYGAVKDCYLLQDDKIACGTYATEEDAEEALKVRETILNGMRCDVTTFKSGNRKIFIRPLLLSERDLRLYFEKNYGPVLRVENIQFHTPKSCFILFLKVDSAVACRDKNHCISGCTVFARPGCTPGTRHQPDRASMYRVATRFVEYNWPVSPPQQRKDSTVTSVPTPTVESPIRYDSPSFRVHRSPPEIVSPASSEASTDSFPHHSHKATMSPFHNTSPSYCDLVDEMKDLSLLDDKVVKKKKSRRVIERHEESVLDWRNTPTTTTEVCGRERFSSEDKWEKKRKELNLPPMDPCAHYATGEDGFPLHHKGQYVRSILKDGRFRIKDNHRVSFGLNKNTVEMFIRDEHEYSFFGPSKIIGSRTVKYDDDEIGGWGNENTETKKIGPRGGFPPDLTWPFTFPSRPQHFPLMEKCTYEDEISLEFGAVVRYLHHLEARWTNTKQEKFLTDFAPFLRTECTVCRVKLEGTRKQFEHIFSKPHLSNLNQNKVKYSPSDFTFWHNLLLRNYDTGARRK